MEEEKKERTLVAIKPEAVRDKALGEIDRRITSNFQIEEIVIMRPTRELAEAHYAEHHGKEFFERTVAGFCAGRVWVMVVSGPGAINRWRQMMGDYDEATRQPGTIRGDFMKPGQPFHENYTHGSVDEEAFQREYALWKPYLQ